MIDFSDYKVPVFPGKNDVPRVPTAQLEGNGADLVQRFNGTLDDLQTLLGISWILTTPTYNQITKLDIFFSALSESRYESNALMFLYNERIASFTPNTDYVPGNSLDISNLVAANGPGLYFFVYKLQNNSYWEEVKPSSNNPVPKGAVRYVNSKSLSIIETSESPDGYNVQSNAPLVVVQPFATVTFTAEEFIIG